MWSVRATRRDVAGAMRMSWQDPKKRGRHTRRVCDSYRVSRISRAANLIPHREGFMTLRYFLPRSSTGHDLRIRGQMSYSMGIRLFRRFCVGWVSSAHGPCSSVSSVFSTAAVSQYPRWSAAKGTLNGGSHIRPPSQMICESTHGLPPPLPRL